MAPECVQEHISWPFVIIEATHELTQELEDDVLDKQQMLKASSAELAEEQRFEEAMEKLTEAQRFLQSKSEKH